VTSAGRAAPGSRPTIGDPARDALFGLMRGYRASAAPYAAAQLEIADALAGGPATAEMIAAHTKTDAPSLSRLLRLLHVLGIVEARGERYALTPVGELLRSDAPASMRDGVLYSCGLEALSYMKLADGVRTGKTPFEIAFGSPTFDYLAKPENAAWARHFDGFMRGLTAVQSQALIAAYDFGGHDVVADIGGGDGTLLVGLLRAHPTLRGILYDLPHVVAGAQTHIEQAGVRERCTLVGGSFFDEVPTGGDAYVLKFILHDWTDEECVRILENCRRAMPREGRLLVFDRIIPDDPTDPAFAEAVFADIHMFAGPGGRERTRAEFEALFARTGFSMTRVIRTSVAPQVIEAAVV